MFEDLLNSPAFFVSPVLNQTQGRPVWMVPSAPTLKRTSKTTSLKPERQESATLKWNHQFFLQCAS